jgi:hypothetical protein
MNIINVKVLSGLHEGAEWSFTSGEVMIGGNAQCTIFLCDDEVPEYCVTLKIIGNRITCLYVDEKVAGAEELASRIGKWVYPDQHYELDCNGIKIQLSVLDASGQLLTSVSNFFKRHSNTVFDCVQRMGVQLVVGTSIALSCLSSVLLIFFGSGTPSSNAATNLKVDYQNAAQIAESNVLSAKTSAAMLQFVKDDLTNFAQKNSIEYGEFKVENGSVEIKAEMSRKHLKKFEALLEKTAKFYGNNISLKVDVALSEQQRTVDELLVKSVKLGSQPAVVLESGERLFVGASYKGLELIKINQNEIVFKSDDSVYEVFI